MANLTIKGWPFFLWVRLRNGFSLLYFTCRSIHIRLPASRYFCRIKTRVIFSGIYSIISKLLIYLLDTKSTEKHILLSGTASLVHHICNNIAKANAYLASLIFGLLLCTSVRPFRRRTATPLHAPGSPPHAPNASGIRPGRSRMQPSVGGRPLRRHFNMPLMPVKTTWAAMAARSRPVSLARMLSPVRPRRFPMGSAKCSIR